MTVFATLGSPFILDIADANSVSVYGDNLRMAAVDRLSTFMVHAAGAESKDLSVVITGLSKKETYIFLYRFLMFLCFA